jgi:hypothetical protein
MAQLPQPSQLLCWVRSKRDSVTSYYGLDRVIVKSTKEDIQTAVANAWKEEQKKLVGHVLSHLQKAGIAPKDAVKDAEMFVFNLENINGQSPTAFLPIEKVKVRVNELILKLPSEAQSVFLKYEGMNLYSEYAYNFMDVEVLPIVVEVGGNVPKLVVDLEYSKFMLVYTTISLPDLDKVTLNPTELTKYFKWVVLDKSTHFVKGMQHSSEISYMKKACNILVHKMFERHGIDLTGQTAEQIREKMLKNIKHYQGLTNFSAIDSALGDLVSFLSNTYIRI